jgi:deoxyadenosine/deoxycytidine kinase
MERIKKRGRKQEVDNLDSNKDYFKNLLNTYKTKLEAQCKIYNIPYMVVDTSYLKSNQIFDIILERIANYWR